MAIYKIFPESDTFIYSETPTANAGRDEILEIGGYRDITGLGRTKRPNTPNTCLLYTSPSPRDRQKSRMPSSA